jgi:hypothetical protein
VIVFIKNGALCDESDFIHLGDTSNHVRSLVGDSEYSFVAITEQFIARYVATDHHHCIPECTWCGAVSVALAKCAECKLFAYCSKDCQTRHWKKVHRETCKENRSYSASRPFKKLWHFETLSRGSDATTPVSIRQGIRVDRCRPHPMESGRMLLYCTTSEGGEDTGSGSHYVTMNLDPVKGSCVLDSFAKSFQQSVRPPAEHYFHSDGSYFAIDEEDGLKVYYAPAIDAPRTFLHDLEEHFGKAKTFVATIGSDGTLYLAVAKTLLVYNGSGLVSSTALRGFRHFESIERLSVDDSTHAVFASVVLLWPTDREIYCIRPDLR